MVFLDCLHSLHHEAESWDDHIRKFLRCSIDKYKLLTLWFEYFFWSKYELSEKDNVSAGILKIITEMFLPHIGLSELEEECFSKILPKVNNMLNTCRL